MSSKQYCYICKIRREVSMHLFPKNATRRKQWLNAFNLSEDDILKNTRVCGKHFEPDSFISPMLSGYPVRLKGDAVPTLLLERRSSRSPTPINNSVPNLSAVATTSDVMMSSIQSPASATITSEPNEKITSPIRLMSSIQSSASATVMQRQDDISNGEPMDTSTTTTPRRALGKTKRRTYGIQFLNQCVDFSTPRRSKRHFDKALQTIMHQKHKLKMLNQKVGRLNNKVISQNQLLKDLRQKNLISTEAELTMKAATATAFGLFIKRIKQGKRDKYDPELRKFALTLQFYSPVGYMYVRRKLNNLLPHPVTIRKWYANIDGTAGFTAEAFQTIKNKVIAGEEIVLNVVFDEISIRENIHWDGKKFHGYVDMGTNFDTALDSIPKAKNALVFMAVSLNSYWKIALGYFLVTTLTGQEKASLVTKCFDLLYETGAKTFSLTFDGAAANLSMCHSLGCNIDVLSADFKPWFIHHYTKVFIFLDAVHMLKLFRNCLGSKGIIIDDCNNPIKWDHFINLHNLQVEEGLHAANKLTKHHINWQQNKMNVKLAAQTLSNSVADAIQYCNKNLKLEQFHHSEGTVKFCRMINKAFDMLNVRNIFSKIEFKRPMSESNFHILESYAKEFTTYIKNLKYANGLNVISSDRKTGFIGFIIDLENVLNLYKTLVTETSMKYLLSYKLSQDHLEIFFSSVRSHGGYNNNPSAYSFMSIYKKLLVHHEIRGSTKGNCVDFHQMTCLEVASGKSKRLDSLTDDDIIEMEQEVFNTDHNYAITIYNSVFVDDVIGYISGFIVNKICKYIKCDFCIQQLRQDISTSALQNIKNRGRLTCAAKDVVLICKISEKVFREEERSFSKHKNLSLFLMQKVLIKVNLQVFNNHDMMNHIEDQDIFDNHRIQLIKIIIKKFFTIRLHHYTKTQNKTDSKRRVLHTLITFRNE